MSYSYHSGREAQVREIARRLQEFGLAKFFSSPGVVHTLCQKTVSTGQLAVRIGVGFDDTNIIMHPPDSSSRNFKLYEWIFTKMGQKCTEFVQALEDTHNDHVTDYIGEELEKIVSQLPAADSSSTTPTSFSAVPNSIPSSRSPFGRRTLETPPQNVVLQAQVVNLTYQNQVKMGSNNEFGTNAHIAGSILPAPKPGTPNVVHETNTVEMEDFNKFGDGAKVVAKGTLENGEKNSVTDGICVSKPRGTEDEDFELDLISLGNNGAAAYALALIINIHYYDKKEGKNYIRQGSEEDFKRIVETFEKFGLGIFAPVTYDERTGRGIRVSQADVERWIGQFKAKFPLDGAARKKACFVVIMGHGDRPGKLLDSSHAEFSIEDKIFGQFNNQRFPVMIDCPKLFFMNCCRGDQRLPPVIVDGPGPSTNNLKVEDEADIGPGSSRITVPAVSDLLIFWSTVPETVSWRNPATGAKFIKILCEVLDGYLESLEEGEPEEDIQELYREVADGLGDLPSTHNASQIPNIDIRRFGRFYWQRSGCKYIRNSGSKYRNRGKNKEEGTQ